MPPTKPQRNHESGSREGTAAEEDEADCTGSNVGAVDAAGFTTGLSVSGFWVGCFVGLPVTGFEAVEFSISSLTGISGDVGFVGLAVTGFNAGSFVGLLESAVVKSLSIEKKSISG